MIALLMVEIVIQLCNYKVRILHASFVLSQEYYSMTKEAVYKQDKLIQVH